ncbi:MAG TPA: TIGR02449 family protein [Candidatus Tenderia sp.]|nr:TIGR02449 family protein [Candidatus Tenderia sp.]
MSEDAAQKYEQELSALEVQVGELVALCQQLKSENQALRNQNAVMKVERAELIEKNELARSRLESMISRLRSMEQDYGHG